MTQRPATHAGSWYSDDGPTLSKQLDQWLDQVPDTIDGIGPIPQPGARIIIAPTRAHRHAGYAYSGPAAAWAYKSLDLSHAKQIFLLGPSHHTYLPTAALSPHSTYLTPLGPLRLSSIVTASLHSSGHFDTMSPRTDADEHSLEMHLPYLYKVLERAFPDGPASFPDLVPILVGGTSAEVERVLGTVLAPYLADAASVVIVSSDFCHWGKRFGYTYYLPSSPSPSSPDTITSSSSSSSSSTTITSSESSMNPTTKTTTDSTSNAAGYALKSSHKTPTNPPIHASISEIDKQAMRAIESGSHEKFLANLRETANTVCGRHPIGVVMAALEILRAQEDGGRAEREGGGARDKGRKERGRFQFIRYEQSSRCVRIGDSSVSYGSAFAVL
ncbi:hypothetical protein MMC16_004144 [Acarospora aff. strigata]|nr:hypothetical protein [Acarospora aff. strigata]